MIITGLVTLGRDAELKFTQSGTALCSFSGAYNIGYGDKKESVWLKCSIFGKQAEGLNQHLVKGTKLNIVGKDLKINTYQKQDGTTASALECIVTDIDFASKPQQGAQMQPHQPTPQAQYQPQQNFQQPQRQPAPQYAQNNFADSDVPF